MYQAVGVSQPPQVGALVVLFVGCRVADVGRGVAHVAAVLLNVWGGGVRNGRWRM